MEPSLQPADRPSRRWLVPLAAASGVLAAAVTALVIWAIFSETPEAEDEAACAARVRVDRVATAPRECSVDSEIYRWSEMRAVPHLVLGTVRMTGDEKRLRKIQAAPTAQSPCLHRALGELGANVFTVDGVEGSGETAALVEKGYLVHAGPVAAAHRTRLARAACMVTEVHPGSDAARAGLVAGDLLVGLKGREAPAGDACAVSEAVRTVPDGEEVTAEISRGGAAIEVRLSRSPGAGKFGYAYMLVPVLPERAVPAAQPAVDSR